MNNDLVYWSVLEANRRRANTPKPYRSPCPVCHTDSWYARNDVNPEYRSEYNPGEYVEFTCANCGYSWESPC